MRIFLDDRGSLIFTYDGTFVEGNPVTEYFGSDHGQGLPEDWYPDCKPKKEFTPEEVYSILETLIEVLQNK